MSDIESLVDRSAIVELFARYAHTIDGYDADGWADCFTEDGIFEVRSADGGLQFVGRAALRNFAMNHIELLPGTRHVMTNHVIELDGPRAHHRCTLTGMLSRPEQVYTFVSGWYDSDVSKTSGEWRINHRKVYLDNADNFVDGALAGHMRPMMEWIAANGQPV